MKNDSGKPNEVAHKGELNEEGNYYTSFLKNIAEQHISYSWPQLFQQYTQYAKTFIASNSSTPLALPNKTTVFVGPNKKLQQLVNHC